MVSFSFCSAIVAACSHKYTRICTHAFPLLSRCGQHRRYPAHAATTLQAIAAAPLHTRNSTNRTQPSLAQHSTFRIQLLVYRCSCCSLFFVYFIVVTAHTYIHTYIYNVFVQRALFVCAPPLESFVIVCRVGSYVHSAIR